VLARLHRPAKILDSRTVQFDFKRPFRDFPRLTGTANVCGVGWVVAANCYEKVGRDGFAAKPIGARAARRRVRRADDRELRDVHGRMVLLECLELDLRSGFLRSKLVESRRAFVNTIGPRIATQKWQDVFPSFVSTGYAYPWEEGIKLKA